MTLLQQRDLSRQQRRLDALQEARTRLKAALAELVPGRRVILFGSITRPGAFNDRSDIDLAFDSQPLPMSIFRLTAELMDRLDRPVDVALLDRCRFRQKIVREGEAWIA